MSVSNYSMPPLRVLTKAPHPTATPYSARTVSLPASDPDIEIIKSS